MGVGVGVAAAAAAEGIFLCVRRHVGLHTPGIPGSCAKHRVRTRAYACAAYIRASQNFVGIRAADVLESRSQTQADVG